MGLWDGREVEVLVEGPSKRDSRRWSGRTVENRVVSFRGPAAAGRPQGVRIGRNCIVGPRFAPENFHKDVYAAGETVA